MEIVNFPTQGYNQIGASGDCPHCTIRSYFRPVASYPEQINDQVDDLSQNGKITESLNDFAHAVRLSRNIGAHPDKDGLKDVSKTDADDIIEFTRQFLHLVHVMPAKCSFSQLR